MDPAADRLNTQTVVSNFLYSASALNKEMPGFFLYLKSLYRVLVKSSQLPAAESGAEQLWKCEKRNSVRVHIFSSSPEGPLH